MRLSLKSVSLFGIFLSAVIGTASAVASTYSPTGSTNGLKVLAESTAEADYITLNKANSSGISVNTFSDFSVSGKPLKLLHGGMQDPNYQPAKLIVIKSQRISLANTIELVGETANILFIDSDTSTTSTLSCTGCRLENFGRITLAAASSQFNLSLSSSILGKLSTFSGGTVSINGMETAGAYSLEVIAERLNTAGEINTHIRGQVDANGGYTAASTGNSIIGVAGINLYVGTMALMYESLDVAPHGSSTFYQAEQALDGTLKAAMINIVSSRPLHVKSSATLSTQSDLLSTSMHAGEFNALLEGVYLQTSRPDAGEIRLDGKVVSDNLVQVLAQGDLEINNALSAYRADLFSASAIKIASSGKIAAETATVGANWLTNRGAITVNSLAVETIKTLYNHFGGKISGDGVSLVSLEGAVVNGSRTNKLHTPADLQGLHLDPEFNGDDKYGIYQLVKSESGSIQSTLSALITGNSVHIKAKRFENINPYHMVKSDNETWADGVVIDIQKARRVSVQAEGSLQILATDYVLNASAVIGLNQAGSIDINTPLLMNQRYRTEATLAVYSRISYDQSGGIPTSSKSNVNEIETYLTAYSPPGIFYTFGDLTFSDGVENNSAYADFINQFSFVEVLSDSHFHDSQLHSLGLAMAARETAGFEPVRCAAYGCSTENYVSLIESETLTSFGGNVYGLSSDLNVQTVNQLEDVSKQSLIDAFVQQRRDEVAYEKTFVNPTSVGGDVTTYHYLSKWEITNRNNSEYLVITVSRCNKIEYYAGNVSNTCLQSHEEYPVSNILNAEAGESLLNGLPWTGNEVRDKARDYVNGLSYSGSLSVTGHPSVSGTYVAEYVIYKITDDNEFIIIDYVQKFEPNNASSLNEAQGRTAGYYRVSKSVTVRLQDLMGSITPDVPSNINVNYTLSSGQANFTVSWNAVSGNNIEYTVSPGGSTSGTSLSTSRNTVSGDNSFSFRVKACNSVACSNWSSPKTVSFQLQPSASELASCTASFYRPFTNKYRMPFIGVNGNYCAITTVSGTTYLVIAEQRQQYYPDGRTTYGRCEYVRYFNRSSVVSAILNDTAFPSPSMTQGAGNYQSCDQMLSFGLTELE